MKLNKLRTLNVTELVKEYKEKTLKLTQYELDLKSGKEKDSAKVKTYRRDVAKILTLLNQKVQLEEVESIVEKIKESTTKIDEKITEVLKEEVEKKEDKKETIKK